MNEPEARNAVKHMFAAHGVARSDEIIAELVTEILTVHCGPCASKVLEQSRTSENAKPLTVPMFRAGYQRALTSPDHYPHLGHDDATSRVSRIERGWHHDAVVILKDLGHPDLKAQFMAARMWASEAMPYDPGLIREYGTDPVWTETGPASPSKDLVEAAWTFARTIAKNPTAQMSDAQWREALASFQSAWNAAVTAEHAA